MASKKEETVDTSNTCVVCFKGVDIYSIGQCDHPVCFECSTRMRVLCGQNECPICRQEMPKVIFTRYVRPFNSIRTDNYLTDYKFKINFETQEEASAFEILLAHECPKCKKVFSSFTQLRDHVRRTHFLNYCDLCVENLKILSRERRCYTRQELATHRRVGDSDDRSHRGHPLCEFCDTRYMDNDELYRHLRRDHLYCHFCDADGLHQYYNTYDFLREHFRNEHYLCEEGECYNEKFTAVFRSDIDLKAHRTTAHGKGLGKAGLKQARTLDIEFTLAPRPRPIPRRQYREEDADAGAVGGSAVVEEPVLVDRNNLQFSQLNTDCIEEFPTLGGSQVAASSGGSGQLSGGGGGGGGGSGGGRNTASSIIRRGCGRLCDDDFPALGLDSTGSSTTQVSLKVNSERPPVAMHKQQPPQTSRPSSTNVSIQVNHPRFTTTVTSHNTYNYHFPALDSSGNIAAGPTGSSTSVHWTSKRIPENKPSPPSQHTLVTTAGASGHDPPPGLEAFPALTTSTVKNKTSLLQQPITTNQTSSTNTAVTANSDCDQQPTSLSTTTKTKKKKSRSKNTNATATSTNVEMPVKYSEGSGNSSSNKKKSNNHDVKNSGADSTTTPPSASKKKAKENMLHSSNESKINNNLNHINNNNNNNNCNNHSNRKVLKSPKVENVNKANNVNHSVKNKKEDYSKSLLQGREKISTELVEKKKENKVKTLPEKCVIEPESFPVLGNSGVPPGFQPKWQVKRPPPGLEKPTNLLVAVPPTPSAPPGFNGFPPLGPNLDSTKMEYKTPPNFAKRNSALVTKMASALGADSFELFKQASFAFRSGNVRPHEYYSSCREIMGPNTFSELFPELLALLPDIDKQQELWTVYKSENGKEQEVVRPSSTSKKKGGSSSGTGSLNSSSSCSPLDVCATCHQVVTTSDLRSHLAGHALDNHFPVLDTSAQNSTAFNNNAWVQQHHN